MYCSVNLNSGHPFRFYPPLGSQRVDADYGYIPVLLEDARFQQEKKRADSRHKRAVLVILTQTFITPNRYRDIPY